MNAPHPFSQATLIYKTGRLFFVLGALVFFLACAHKRPSPIPGHPPSYKVLGNWYQPISDSHNFKQRGLASWYGPQFHGKRTANGEIYDMHALTAAHKTLPLGTRVRVLNLSNGKDVVVRINDRGPFVKGRIIDLSLTAAKTIGITGKGTGRVEITALSHRTAPEVSPSEPGHKRVYTLQVGSFSEKTNAESLVKSLTQKHKDVSLVAEQGFFKVRVGRFSKKNDADQLKDRLTEKGYPAFTVSILPGS
ncbi:MAG: septal ring lytic transglycosylase RlpA family protein [Proteobacteria bacterium]|nr:septal ring lytic transglycosylase RlpA family protein [Pseudomonadota bacterium]